MQRYLLHNPLDMDNLQIYPIYHFIQQNTPLIIEILFFTYATPVICMCRSFDHISKNIKLNTLSFLSYIVVNIKSKVYD